jgi:Holliday junction resolvase RusA-like endonuclease
MPTEPGASHEAQRGGASHIDRPFAPPLECVIDLPFPPSVNRIWRSQQATNGRKIGVYLSAEYRAWSKHADIAVIANGSWRSRVAMPAEFTAVIQLNRAQRAGDIDNRIKAVLDWAQRAQIIGNDRLCEALTARWVATIEAPSGCRLILRSVA